MVKVFARSNKYRENFDEIFRNKGPIVRVAFSEGLQDKWPTDHLWGTAKIPGGDPNHPHGQWSIKLDFQHPPDDEGQCLARAEFLSPKAPTHLLGVRGHFNVYNGSTMVATVIILEDKDCHEREPTCCEDCNCGPKEECSRCSCEDYRT